MWAVLKVVSDHLWLVAVGVFATSLVGSAPADAEQARSRRVRTISHTSRPIAESLRPDDDIVVLPRIGAGGTLSEIDTREKMLAAFVAGGYATVAIIDVTGVTSLLADGGTVIHTQFVGTVADVLSRGAKLAATDVVEKGQNVEFARPGGEVAIRGVIVREDPVVDYPYPARYVAFLGRRRHENGWGTSLSAPLLLNNGTASAVPPAVSLLEGITLDELRAAIAKRR